MARQHPATPHARRPGPDDGQDSVGASSRSQSLPRFPAAEEAPRIVVLTRDTLDPFLAARRQAIVLLGTTSPRNFLPAIAHHFAQKNRNIGLAYFNVHELSERAWILSRVRGAWTGEGRRLRAARSGYYFFVRTQVVGFHPGLHDPSLQPAMQRIEEALQSGQRLNEAVEQFQAVARRAAALVVQHFDEALLRHRSGLNGARINPYAILGVERTATREEIKAAYRSLMRQHHPDRASALGDAQARELAHRRAQEIVLAYQMLSRQVR